MSRIDFNDLSYLSKGNSRQQRAYKVIDNRKIMKVLNDFTPFLAGTIPLGVDIPESDLDIICCFHDSHPFLICIDIFKEHADYQFKHFRHNGVETVIAGFFVDGLRFEIFGQPRPVRIQEAYRHLLIEQEILLAKGEAFAKEVVALKESGMKTEPAFAHLLGLTGDPYAALLSFDLRML